MFETVAGWIIWGAAAVGYVGILALTERSADRYVKNPRSVRATTTVQVIVAAPATRVPDVTAPYAAPSRVAVR